MPKSRVNKRGGRRVTRGGQKTRRLRHSKKRRHNKRSLAKRRGRRRRRRRTRKGGSAGNTATNFVLDSRHRGAFGEPQDEFGLVGALAGVTLGAAESAVNWGHGRFKRRKPRATGDIKRMSKGFHRSNIIINSSPPLAINKLDNGRFQITWSENDKGITYIGSGIISHHIQSPIEGNDGYKISFISQRGGFTLTTIDSVTKKGWPRNEITFSWGSEQAATNFYNSLPEDLV